MSVSLFAVSLAISSLEPFLSVYLIAVENFISISIWNFYIYIGPKYVRSVPISSSVSVRRRTPKAFAIPKKIAVKIPLHAVNTTHPRSSIPKNLPLSGWL